MLHLLLSEFFFSHWFPFFLVKIDHKLKCTLLNGKF
jgi:hypothetical protein